MANDPMMTTDDLAARLGEAGLRILDASLYMPGDPRDARAEFESARIPGAVFLDLEAIGDPATGLPHMAPTPDTFARTASALGIGDGDTVVVYDQLGLFSAARAWWTFRLMGWEKVFVVDGGLSKWKAEGKPTDSGPSETPKLNVATARYDSQLVRSIEKVKSALETGREQLVDARGAARFTGETAEPRAGLRGGHMPGARNVPFTDLLAPDATLKPASALAGIFRDAGVDVDKPIVTTCGSGVTASVLALALMRLGRQRAAVYDGSWTEWGGRDDTDIVTGPA